MRDNRLIVTFLDKNRLLILIDACCAQGFGDSRHVRDLRRDLKHAAAVAPERIARNVITMSSTFRYTNLASDEQRVATLTFPGEAGPVHGCLSILSPLGALMIGRAAGDVVEGSSRFRVEEVLYQPEACGEYVYKGPYTVANK